jgi:ATP-dependent Clp protease adaptor protein ClpS
MGNKKMANAEPVIVSKIKPNVKLAEPPMYNVIYMNDEVTTQEFVVSSLVTHFRYSEDTAEDITMDIHVNGSAVVAILPYEIAEQKGTEVTVEARQQGYPLQVKLEAS